MNLQTRHKFTSGLGINKFKYTAMLVLTPTSVN
jgi:hypothetical protein